MNYAFYVSGKATRFNKIISQNNEEMMKNVKAVISDSSENIYLKEKLEKFDIKFVLFDYNSILVEKERKNIELSNCILEVLKKYEIDYCFSFGDHILKGTLLYEYQNRIINFHPSLLPAYPGLKAIDQAIAGGANLLGNTAHFIDAGMDTGPVIMQSVISVAAFYQSGYDIILDIQIEMLFKIYQLLEMKKLQVVNNRVQIIDADYNEYSIFPYV